MTTSKPLPVISITEDIMFNFEGNLKLLFNCSNAKLMQNEKIALRELPNFLIHKKSNDVELPATIPFLPTSVGSRVTLFQIYLNEIVILLAKKYIFRE